MIVKIRGNGKVEPIITQTHESVFRNWTQGLPSTTLQSICDAVNEYIKRDVDGTPLHNWIETLVRHLNGQQPHLDLPLDVQATAFQWRVWQALQAIPYGETRSYSEIARTIGRPTASRAVANACATNPVAIAVPCHRVVYVNGDIGGYRWGETRKQQLLEKEAEHVL